ncbi:MAG: hypothetical protein QOK48_755 [Blastocatellia bacterium]|jgi:hypothetical protein|nr:hypothetical protein [Blastocatellia bacterium]
MLRTGFTSLIKVAVGSLAASLCLSVPPEAKSPRVVSARFEVPRAMTQNPPRIAAPLLAGPRLERKLSGGESHLYEVQMAAEDFLDLEIEQKGIDVALVVFDPVAARFA